MGSTTLLRVNNSSCGSAGKESACNAGDLSLIPELGRFPGEGKGYPLHYFGLEKSMDYSPWNCKESDTTERLSLSMIAVTFKMYSLIDQGRSSSVFAGAPFIPCACFADYVLHIQ